MLSSRLSLMDKNESMKVSAGVLPNIHGVQRSPRCGKKEPKNAVAIHTACKMHIPLPSYLLVAVLCAVHECHASTVASRAIVQDALHDRVISDPVGFERYRLECLDGSENACYELRRKFCEGEEALSCADQFNEAFKELLRSGGHLEEFESPVALYELPSCLFQWFPGSLLWATQSVLRRKRRSILYRQIPRSLRRIPPQRWTSTSIRITSRYHCQSSRRR